MKRNFVSRLLDLVYPPKCVVCGTVVYGDVPFCSVCFEKWQLAIRAKCDNCGNYVSHCRCGVSALYNSGVKDHIKLFFYDKGTGGAANRLVYAVKRNNDRLLFAFAADELSKTLGAYLEARQIERKNVMITYPARTAKAKNASGYDQAEKIAMMIAKRLGIQFKRTAVRRGGAVQKMLNSAERAENARKSLFPIDGLNVSGKFAVVFDDVITSGATVGRMAQILYEAGADEVIALSLAKSRLNGEASDDGVYAENE